MWEAFRTLHRYPGEIIGWEMFMKVLAKLVDRNFAAVFRDCTRLESIGFIKLMDNEDAKNSKTPLLKFDYDRTRVNIPCLRLQRHGLFCP